MRHGDCAPQVSSKIDTSPPVAVAPHWLASGFFPTHIKTANAHNSPFCPIPATRTGKYTQGSGPSEGNGTAPGHDVSAPGGQAPRGTCDGAARCDGYTAAQTSRQAGDRQELPTG